MTDKRNLMTVIKRIAFTLLIILIYIMGTYIPVPFADITARYEQIMGNTSLSLMSVMSGANFLRLSIFSLGLNPFMIVTLLMQLLIFTKFLGLDALSMNQIQIVQQVMLLAFTIVQAFFFTYSMIPERNFKRDLTVVLILTAGSLLTVWFCFMNVKFGIGGTMPIILVNIIISLIPTLSILFHSLLKVKNYQLWIFLVTILTLLVTFFWIAFNHAYYPLKVIDTSLPSYAKEVVTPIGLNIGAMMTYMIGMAILSLPTMMRQFFPRNSIINNTNFNMIVTAILSFILFYFFTFMTVDPKETAKSMRDKHSYIPTIRPGKPTQKYLTHLLLIVTFPGAFLTTLQIMVGLYGRMFLDQYAGITVIPMNVMMLTLFLSGMEDKIKTMLYPHKYDRLMKEE